MTVHNFQVETDIDGRKTTLSGGPASATGGFTTTVYIRGEGGSVETALRITGEAGKDGELRLYVTPGDPPHLISDSPFEAWPDSMTIARYPFDSDGYGFKITSRR